MRVIAGTSKGIKLISPEGMHTRPTLDRIKEAIFSSIAFDLPNSSFLDIFSGTGSMGIEALSRGAKVAVFIENSNECVDIINKNLIKTHLESRSKIFNLDAFHALNKLAKEDIKFDIVFMDPPYNDNLVPKVLEEICNLKILNKEAIIICEQSSKVNDPKITQLEIFKIKKYKTTKVIFLKFIGDKV